jgi:putative serine protease PepD
VRHTAAGEESFVSTPFGTGNGPVVYPEYPQNAQPGQQQPYAPYPPLGPTADAPRPPKKSGSNTALKAVGLLAGAGIIAVSAGVIGGATGYVIAREQLPTPAASAAVAQAAALPSTVPGSIASIAAKVQPSVVQLNVTSSQESGTGSGFIVSSDGYIITNNHVAGMAGNGGSIEVAFADGSTAQGKLVGANADYDIAVVKVDKTGLPALTMGDSSALSVGDSVIAVGSPLGLSGTVTTGIVSALNRPVTSGGAETGTTSYIDAIQTDAAINPGNSGGPLLDGNGNVIGVNSAIATMGSDGTTQSGSIGLGFAIPIDTVQRVADEIMKTGSATTPVIGVSLDQQYDGPGARVAQVTSGSGAEAAGLQPGDVITKVDGQVMTDSTQVIVTIRAKAPGDTVTLTVERGGSTQDIPVTLKASS